MENNLFPLKVGVRWVFINLLKRVQKWVKSGFWGPKAGQNASNPHLLPTLNPFRDHRWAKTRVLQTDLSVPWSLRPQHRAAAATAAVVAASIAAATETCGDVFFCWVCDWYAGSPIGQCDSVQSYPQETRRKLHSHRVLRTWGQLLVSGLKALAPWLKNRTRLASFWRFSGDFSAAADPKLTCLRRGSVFSCLRCVFAQAFAINPFGKLPKITLNNCKLRSCAKLR